MKRGLFSIAAALLTVSAAAALAIACGDDDATPASTPNADGGDGSTNPIDGSSSGGNDAGGDGTTPSNGTDMVLDPTFGNGGTYAMAFVGGSVNEVTGLVVQSNGAVVVAYLASNKDTADLVRVTPAGQKDTTFGGAAAAGSGIVDTSVKFGRLIASPGKDLLTVSGSPPGDMLGSTDIARFLAAGEIDNGFGVSGHASIGTGGGVPVVQKDGKVLSGLSGGSIITRFDTSGNPDSTFGTSGQTTIVPFARYSIRAIAEQADNKVVASGDVHDDAGVDVDCVVVRTGIDGIRDPGFGIANNETLIADGCRTPQFIGQSSDAKLLLQASHPTNGLILARLNPNGSIDTTYTAPVGISQPSSNALMTFGDKLLLLSHLSGKPELYAMRFAPNGGPDTSFSPNGARKMNEAWFSQQLWISLQPDGKLVVAGLVKGTLTIGRYLP